MDIDFLVEQIKSKASFLCIGLDSDINKIPNYFLEEEDPIYSFNKCVIDTTHQYAVAYKPNIAFYESIGIKGWRSLQKTIDYLNSHYPKILTIADAKRGDIGNTAKQYAKTFFDLYNFDAVTVNPYMGLDTLEPFLSYEDKFTIVLSLTSNSGSFDFQMLKTLESTVYEEVVKTLECNNSRDNIMYVVGATKSEQFKSIRKLAPNSFFLVPGVGKQGGTLKSVCANGLNERVGLIVNVSRDILYTDSDDNFIDHLLYKASGYQSEMKAILKEKFLI